MLTTCALSLCCGYTYQESFFALSQSPFGSVLSLAQPAFARLPITLPRLVASIYGSACAANNRLRCSPETLKPSCFPPPPFNYLIGLAFDTTFFLHLLLEVILDSRQHVNVR